MLVSPHRTFCHLIISKDYDGILGPFLEPYSTVTNPHECQMPWILTPTARSLVLWLSTWISIAFCLLRIWLRKWRRQHLTYGDYWILLTLPFMVLYVVIGFFTNLIFGSLERVQGMYQRKFMVKKSKGERAKHPPISHFQSRS